MQIQNHAGGHHLLNTTATAESFPSIPAQLPKLLGVFAASPRAQVGSIAVA